VAHDLLDLTQRISDSVKEMDALLSSPGRVGYGSQIAYVICHSVRYAIGGKLLYDDIEDISTDHTEYGGWKMFELFFDIGDALQC
jgi:hypothetical protein